MRIHVCHVNGHTVCRDSTASAPSATLYVTSAATPRRNSTASAPPATLQRPRCQPRPLRHVAQISDYQIRLQIRLRSVCKYNGLLMDGHAATTLMQIREGSFRERPNTCSAACPSCSTHRSREGACTLLFATLYTLCTSAYIGFMVSTRLLATVLHNYICVHSASAFAYILFPYIGFLVSSRFRHN